MAIMKDREKAFAEYYVQTGNCEQSAIKAGYSPKYARGNAHKLVARSCIAEYIKELQDKIEKKHILSATERQEMLSMIAKDENEKADARIRAIDTLNKMTGEYVEKVQMSGTLNNPMEGLTTEELKKLIGDD